MKSLNRKEGFTLIELLVVVAIIGILAAVVMSNLSSARLKGADAAVKASLANMRSQAAVYYDANGNNYGDELAGGDCTSASAGSLFDDQKIIAALTQIDIQAASFANCYVSTDGKSYAMAAVLKGTGTFCVDSEGSGKFLADGTSSAASDPEDTTFAIKGTAATSYSCE